MNQVISQEQAELEITKWLDFKKVSAKKREAQKSGIETLISGIVEGNLILVPDSMILRHTLKFPAGVDSQIKSLDYKPMLTVEQVHIHLQNVSATDIHGQILAHVVALTSVSKELVKKLNSEDYGIAQALGLFFMS